MGDPSSSPFFQPAKELLKGPVARRGRGGRGALKLGGDEPIGVLPVDAVRSGRHALAAQEHYGERPVVGVGAGWSAATDWPPQVYTSGRQKYAKLSNAGGALQFWPRC
jgi:hypothetical protein